MPITISDIKYALRLGLKSPWLTLVTVLVLSGGLAISLFTFAVLDTMIYGDLPLPDGRSIERVGIGRFPNFEPLDAYELSEMRAQAESDAEFGVYRSSRAVIGEPQFARNVRSVESDWRIFEFSRTAPLLGRAFVADDASATAEPVAVLSYGAWQSVFSADADIVGEAVRINGRPTRIVGVMPEGFAFPLNTEIWFPITRAVLQPPAYSGILLNAYVRLRPDVSIGAAETELTSILRRVRQQRPDAGGNEPESVSIKSFQEVEYGILGTVLFSVLNLLSLSILLLAAVNVGNLLLARTNERIQEIGVRIALGAPRLRLTVQMTLENVLLCAMGGAIAVFLADRGLMATNGFVGALRAGDMPFWWRWSLNGEVLTAAGVFLLFTILAVSLLPALCVSRVDPNSLLRDGTWAGGGLSMGNISRGLVTLQVTLISLVMIVGGSIAVIAQRASNFESGMDTADLLRVNVDPPSENYPGAAERLRLYEDVLTELTGMPGIDAAAVVQQLGVARFAIEGAEYASPEEQPGAWINVLSETPTPLGPTLLAGRRFDSRDNATGLKTAIVSETLARTEWPNESALGRQIEVAIGGADPEPRVIVGVVGDVRFDPLGVSPVALASIYVPLPQTSVPSAVFLVRHGGNEDQARRAIYETLARIDAGIVPGQIESYEYGLERMTLIARTMTRIFMACGAFAVLLAITGIFGMSSNAVVLKSHEIGLRRALGASNGNVLAIFLARGARQLAIGLAVSVLLSAAILFALSQAFSMGAWTQVLIGVTVLSIISACVLLAVYLSVRRVIRLEPSVTLRHA